MYKCPNCGCELEEDMELYMIGDEVVGCEECVEVIYVNHRDCCEALYQTQQAYIDNAMWDRRLDDL